MNKLEKKYKAMVPKEFKLESITHVNFDPHPYTIGIKHINQANEQYCGVLGEDVMIAIPCARPGCNLSYDEHKSDHVMILSLSCDVLESKVAELLKIIVHEINKDKIDGFAFVKNGFNFIKEEERNKNGSTGGHTMVDNKRLP